MVTRSWVDDVGQRAVASAGEALRCLSAAGGLFHRGAVAKKLKFAVKSRCVGTDPQAASALAVALAFRLARR